MAKNGRYEAPGQIPIIVTDGGDLPNGMHGPWVSYRFEWEKDAEAKAVLWTAFEALCDHAGYKHVPTHCASASDEGPHGG